MTWMPDSNDRRELLTALLDEAGFNYELATNDRGAFYARIGYETCDGAPVILTAIIQELVLRITAHRVLGAGEIDAKDLNALNRDWGFGRFNGTDATASLYLGGMRPIGPFIAYVIGHLADAGVVARGGNAPLLSLAGGLGLSSANIVASLKSADIESREQNGIHASRFSSHRGPDLIVEFYAANENVLAIRARHLTEQRYEASKRGAAMERYNRDLSFGALHLIEEHDLVAWHAEVPVSETGMNAALIDWLVGKAIFVLDGLYADCGLPSAAAAAPRA